MATQGIVAIVKDGRVVMKFVAGAEGYRAPNLAHALKRMRNLPKNAKAGYELAYAYGFGSIEDLVVMTESEIEFHGDVDLSPLYRETFNQPRFNPRWKQGTADYVEVVTR